MTVAWGCGLWSMDVRGGEQPQIALKGIAYPTGIDHWPARKAVLFADYGGNIHGLSQDGTHATRILEVRVSDCTRTMRLRIDETRNRLWVMSAAGICVYDLQSLRLIKHLPVDDMSGHRLANGLTDIALDAQGNAYAVDTGIDPVIYRIESATFAVATWNKAATTRDAGVYSPRHFPLNAVAVTPQGKHLLYVNAYAGTLQVLDMTGKQNSTITLPHKLYAVNGLVAAPGGASAGGMVLYAISAKNGSVTVIGLDGDMKTARSRVHATKHLDQPLAGAMVQGSLFVTNSQLLRHPGILPEDRDAPRPFSIVRLSPGYFAEQAARPVADSVLGP